MHLTIQLERVPSELLITPPNVRLTTAEENWYTWAVDRLDALLFEDPGVLEDDHTLHAQLSYLNMLWTEDAESLCSSAHDAGEDNVPASRRVLRSLVRKLEASDWFNPATLAFLCQSAAPFPATR